MRNLICFGFFFLMPFLVKAQEFTLVQINAKWNIENNLELNIFENVDYKFAYLEDQKSDIKGKINAVPVVILYKGNKPVHQWNADLSFKLELECEEIQSIINKYN
jgi:hypothetical protein